LWFVCASVIWYVHDALVSVEKVFDENAEFFCYSSTTQTALISNSLKQTSVRGETFFLLFSSCATNVHLIARWMKKASATLGKINEL